MLGWVKPLISELYINNIKSFVLSSHRKQSKNATKFSLSLVVMFLNEDNSVLLKSEAV